MATMSAFVSGCLALLFFLNASPATAQSTFGNLPSKARLGQKLVVFDDHGNRTLGRLTSVSPSELVITEVRRGPLGAHERWTFHPDDVVLVQKHGPIWDGAVVGGLAALVPSLLVATMCDSCQVAAQDVAMSTAVWAVIGLGIDAAIPPKTLYRRDTAQPRVTVAPLVGRGRGGVAATFRF